MKGNRFINAVITGAGCILGYTLMGEVIETARNPVKRASLKSGFKSIKDAFSKSK